MINFETSYPKALWVAIAIGLLAVLLVGPLVILAIATGSEMMRMVAVVMGMVFWIAALGAIVVYYARLVSGAYAGIKKLPLRDQLW